MDRRLLTVDTKGGADFLCIADAVRAAVSGDIIALRMGLYEEKVHLSKEVELTADNGTERSEAIINSGIIVTANATVRGITIQQQVDIRKGSAVLDRCDISQGSDCIRVCSDARVTIRNCVIYGASAGGDGLYLQEGAFADVEGCDIHSCRVNGIHVRGGELICRNNSIRDCDYGIFFRKSGHGTVEGNVVENVKSFGIYVTGNSDPSVVGNKIRGCDIHGLMVSQNGSGSFRDNQVDSSVRILRGCTPTVAVNTITGRLDNELVVPTIAPILAV